MVVVVVMVVVMCGSTSGGQRFLLAHFIETLKLVENSRLVLLGLAVASWKQMCSIND